MLSLFVHMAHGKKDDAHHQEVFGHFQHAKNRLMKQVSPERIKGDGSKVMMRRNSEERLRNSLSTLSITLLITSFTPFSR